MSSTSSAKVVRRMLISGDEVLAALRNWCGLPRELANMRCQSCEVLPDGREGHKGPAVNLKRLGLLIEWEEELTE